MHRIDTSHRSIVTALLVVTLLALPAAAQLEVHATGAALGSGAAADDDALADLIRGLSSRSAAERIGAAAQLGRLGSRAEPAIPLLVEMLDDDEETPVGFDENGHGWTTTPAYCASGALVAIGHAGVSGLIEALRSRKPKVRELAAQSLRYLDDPRIFEALLAAAEDRNDDVRYSALIGLPADNPRMLEHYLAAAADRSVFIRKLGADRLAAFDDPRAVDALLELVLHDDDVDTVCNATESLAHIGDPRAVSALLDALADTGLDSVARACAAGSLVAFDDPRIYDGLRAAADDAHLGVRVQAARALRAIELRGED